MMCEARASKEKLSGNRMSYKTVPDVDGFFVSSLCVMQIQQEEEHHE